MVLSCSDFDLFLELNFMELRAGDRDVIMTPCSALSNVTKYLLSVKHDFIAQVIPIT